MDAALIELIASRKPVNSSDACIRDFPKYRFFTDGKGGRSVWIMFFDLLVVVFLVLICFRPLLYFGKYKLQSLQSDKVGVGTILHSILSFLVMRCCNSTSKSVVADTLDEDNADLSFALRQEVRISKTLSFLTGESILAPWFSSIKVYT